MTRKLQDCIIGISRNLDYKMDKPLFALENLLETKYKNSNDFTIIGNNIYSKTSISFQTLLEINKINKVKAIFYLSNKSKPFTLGYKIGICLWTS